jgi:hypothetical protein
MLLEVVLTVAESKRLIAKGVTAHPLVQRALQDGMVIIARGSTNGYVAEEILGEAIEKPAFLTGRTLPRGHVRRRKKLEPIGEIVLKRGQAVTGMTLGEAIADLQAGDVFMKGANALDYGANLAGILVGHSEGGTIGAALPTVIARKAHLMIPVGLEKLVASDLAGMSDLITEESSASASAPALWVISNATIVTEIEAVEILARVECLHLASGGIGGAEGSVRLLVSGDEEGVKRAQELFDSVKGEEPYPI